MSINRVFISGNLTRDCELRKTQGGTDVLTFGLAVNDRYRNPQTGEWEDRPNFIDCVLFGARADSLGRIMRKGMKVTVEGKLRYSQWERDGQKRSKVEVIVDEVELPPRMASRDDEGTNYSPNNQNAPQAGSHGRTSDYFEDEYIPF